MTLTEHQKRLAGMFWLIVDYCLANAGKTGFDKWDRFHLFKYVAFCFYSGRLQLAWNKGQIEAVVFAWPDSKTELEARQNESDYKFAWNLPKKGDALFVAEVCGSLRGVARIYRETIKRNPHLKDVPFYTYRHSRLHRLKHLNRFLPPC